jgi:hypothetical protein
MALERPRWLPNEQATSVDLNRLSDLALSNLFLAVSRFVAPPDSIVRGGAVVPTDPASMAVIVQSTAALSSAGEIIILDADTNKAIGASHPTQPRIDLVSIGYLQQNIATEARTFRDPGTGVKSDVEIETKIQSVPQVTVTQGVPAASPAVPATPGGHIPLAVVVVAAGAVSIDAGDIFTVYDKRNEILRTATMAVPIIAVGTPWTSDPVITLATPAGRKTLFLAHLVLNGAQDNQVTMKLEDAGDGTVVGASQTYFPGDIGRNQNIIILGQRSGPTVGPRTYRFRMTVTNAASIPVLVDPSGTGSHLAVAALTL